MSILHSPLLMAGSVLVLYFVYRFCFWVYHGFRVMKPGHTPPKPTLLSRFLRLILGRFFVWLFVGPIRVIGETNLGYFGRLIALGNHQTERDSLLALWMMGARPMRYFIAHNQAGGIRSPLVAYTGGIVVHDKPTSAAAALLAAIKTMRREDDASFMIFPQGELNRHNNIVRKDFKPGTAFLARKVAEKSTTPVAYLPFGIAFDRNPEHATPFHRRMNRWGITGFRKFFGEVVYGGVVVVGSPIPVELLHCDHVKATDALFEQVSILSQQAHRFLETPPQS
jgi:1-acyl-sn-glycerol-3-phosphate acyltransferase